MSLIEVVFNIGSLAGLGCLGYFGVIVVQSGGAGILLECRTGSTGQRSSVLFGCPIE